MPEQPDKKMKNDKIGFFDLGVAYQCNYRCLMCRFWDNSPLNKDNILSMDDWIKVLGQMKDIADDICKVNFSGPGEPLLREGVFGLIKHAKALGFCTQLISNGSVVDEVKAERIIDSGLDFISFSLDSLRPGIHDRLRGVDNAYEKVLKAVDNIVRFRTADKNTRIGINTVISGLNLDDIIELTEWVQNNEEIAFINFQAVAEPFSYNDREGIWFEDPVYQDLWPKDIQKVNEVMGTLISLKEKGYKIADEAEQFRVFKRYFGNPLEFIKKARCNLVYAPVLNIDPAGNIARCQMIGPIGRVAGNMRLKDIYYSDKAQEHISRIGQCERNCHLVVSCYFEQE